MNEISLTTEAQRVALVTGATGFVGGHIARRLVRDGWKVHIVLRPSSRLSDVSEFSQFVCHFHDGSAEGLVHCVELANPTVVFHLASLTRSEHATKDVGAMIESNVLFGNQLLEAMKVNAVSRLINTGTFWQHYNNEDYNPVCLYAATKQAFECILEYYVQAWGVNAITLVLFDTYGLDDRRPKLFYLLNKAADTGVPLDMSAGEQLIDLVHIDDVTEAYVTAANMLLDGKVSHHQTFAVSSGHPLPLREVVKLFVQMTKKNVLVNWGARQYRHREVMVPWNRGCSLPGWEPTIHINEGFKTLASPI